MVCWKGWFWEMIWSRAPLVSFALEPTDRSLWATDFLFDEAELEPRMCPGVQQGSWPQAISGNSSLLLLKQPKVSLSTAVRGDDVYPKGNWEEKINAFTVHQR